MKEMTREEFIELTGITDEETMLIYDEEFEKIGSWFHVAKNLIAQLNFLLQS